MEEQNLKEQENNNSESFQKQSLNKGEDTLKKDQAEKQVKNKFIIKITLPLMQLALVSLSTVAVFIIVVIVGSWVKHLFDNQGENAANAKASAVNTSLSKKAGSSESDTTGIKISYENGVYNIEDNLSEEQLKDIKDELQSKGVNVSQFSDFEIRVIGALMLNGLNEDFYRTEELKLLPLFIKAEACTGYLDLRPNSEKIDSSGNYKPLSADSLKENQIPGTILVQKTNTKDGNVTVLEYRDEQTFNNMLSNNDIDVTNYFTINENGNLVFATWEYTKVEVDGEYPEGVIQTKPEEIYTIKTEEISYNEVVKQYKMPFDFLVQLLSITDEPEFCEEVAKLAFNSKIVLNIQEEETETIETDVQTYDVYNKEEKRINYDVKINGKVVEEQDEYILVGKNEDDTDVKDDEGNYCTTYSQETKKVTVTTTNTSHTYPYEILEADTWLAHYLKTYQPQEKKEISYEPQESDILGDYGEPDKTEDITDENIVNDDDDVKNFKDAKEKEYSDNIVGPKINLLTDTEQSTGKKYTQIKVEDEDKFDQLPPTDKYYEDNLPSNFEVITKPNGKIPKITFSYQLNDHNYELTAPDLANFVKCNISKLQIKEYSKINEHHNITKSGTEYPSDPNPTTKTELYDKKNDKGEFEKFLAVYDKYEYSRAMFNSISSWLFEMMKNNENTVDLVDTIKYLLYKYDGTDYGVTELDTSIFKPDEMHTFTNKKSGSGWWWPIGSENTEEIDGITYAQGNPVSTYISSGVGPRWGKNHGGIDIAGAKRYTNIIATKSGSVIDVMDGFGDGWHNGPDDYCTDGGGYGNYVLIQHDDGMFSMYGHLEKGTIKVKIGDHVEQGQLVGQMGTSGNSTDIHLHFEVRDSNGSKLDPENYVDINNPRPTNLLREWIWNIEGGSQYINGTVWTIFTDPTGNDKTMNLAHGMVIADYEGADSWYPDIIPGKISAGQTVTENQANQIWEIKIKSFNDAIDNSCSRYGVTLTSYQKDALVSYIYRTGFGIGQNNELISAYKDGGNEGLWNYMKEGYNKNPTFQEGTKKRVAEEYELFVKGDYEYNPGNGTTKYDRYCSNPNNI